LNARLPPRPRAVLFDLDGTLADTAPDLIAAVERVCVEEGQPPLAPEVLRPLVGQGGGAMLRRTFGQLTKPRFQRLLARFIAHYCSHICDHTTLFPGMSEALGRLHAAGIPWGIVTNKPHAMACSLMYLLATPPGCIALLGSGAAARAKPYPHGLRFAAEMASVPPQSCWYVGDDLRDVQAASAVPMVSVAAGWGYIKADEDWRHWGADVCCTTVAEFDQLLSNAIGE